MKYYYRPEDDAVVSETTVKDGYEYSLDSGLVAPGASYDTYLTDALAHGDLIETTAYSAPDGSTVCKHSSVIEAYAFEEFMSVDEAIDFFVRECDLIKKED